MNYVVLCNLLSTFTIKGCQSVFGLRIIFLVHPSYDYQYRISQEILSGTALSSVRHTCLCVCLAKLLKLSFKILKDKGNIVQDTDHFQHTLFIVSWSRRKTQVERNL